MNERKIFEKAVDLTDHDARAAFLDQACSNDQELRGRIESLIRSHEDAGSFLEGPAGADALTVDLSPSIALGTHVGPYRLLQSLGEGGMGEVYMAEQTEPVERRVAIKIIKCGMDSRQVIARFEAERQALAMMDHPNIAKVFDAGQADQGRPYFVMELVKGAPITRYCDDHRLTTRQRLELFQDVCHAVQHAHQKGIIHRDLKPSNILVTEYDDRAVLKIIDFGVAKATQQRLTKKTVFTEIGTVMGTIEYMSPEQAKLNQLDIDTRSDVYSLGVLLYELLTGDTPFGRHRLRDAAFDEMLRIIREEEPSRPSVKLATTKFAASVAETQRSDVKRLRKLVRGELDWIVMKALEKERSRRYDTAHAFGIDIRHYLRDEPVLACPPSTTYRIQKLVRRHRGTVTAAAAILVVLLGSSIISGWLAARATTAEDRAEGLLASTAAALDAEQLAHHEADEATDRATHHLFDALLAQARANHFSGRVGQRIGALRAIRQAVEIAKQLDLGEEARRQLRNETIAALTLPDLVEQKFWRGLEHTGAPWALSPTGDTFATVDADWPAETVIVRNTGQDFSLVANISERQSGRTRLIYDLTGKFLCLNQGDGRAGIYDLRNQRWLLESIPAVESSDSIHFSADSRHLAAGCTDGLVRLYSLQKQSNSPNPLAEHVVNGHPASVRFSPDGARLAIACRNDPSIQIRNALSGKLERTLEASDSSLAAIAWHPGGQQLAAGMWQTIERWDLTRDDPRPTISMPGHASMVTNLAFNSDGTLMISDGWDGAVRLWNAAWGRQVLQTGGQLSRSITSDNQAGFSRGVNLGRWKIASPDVCRWSFPERMLGIAVSADGQLVALSFADGVRLINPDSGQQLCHLPIGRTYGVHFDQRTGDLITSGHRGIYAWQLAREKGTERKSSTRLRVGPARQIKPFIGQTTYIACSRQEPMRLLCCHGETQHNYPGLRIRGATLATIGRSEKLRLDAGDVCRIALSSDGRWAATCPVTGAFVQIWDATTGTPAAKVETLGRAYAAFSPDGRWLATNSGHAIRFWRTGEWSLEFEVPARSQNGSAIAFTPDSRLAAFGRDGQGITILDLKSFQELATLAAYSDETRVEKLAFTPSHSYLMAIMGEKGLCTWDLRKIRERLVALELDWDQPPIIDADTTDEFYRQPKILLGQMVRHEFGSLLRHNGELFVAQTIALDRAIREIDAALIHAPHDPQLWYLRGLLHSKFGNFSQASEDLTRCLAFKPKSVNALWQRAKVYRWLGETERALNDFEQVLQFGAEAKSHAFSESMNLLAAILVLGPQKYRDAERAMKLNDQLLQGGTYDSNVLRTRAFCLLRLERYAEAVDAMQQAHRNRGYTGTPLDHFLLASCYAKQGMVALAEEHFRQGETTLAAASSLTTRALRQTLNERETAAQILGRSTKEQREELATESKTWDADQLIRHAVASEGPLWRKRISLVEQETTDSKTSKSNFVLWSPAHKQARIEIPVQVVEAGRYTLTVHFAHHVAGGQFHWRFGDGEPVRSLETYSEGKSLGSSRCVVRLHRGRNHLTFVLTGRADKSEGHQLLLRSIELEPSKSTESETPITSRAGQLISRM